jgi:hypothetical protein
MPNYLRVLNGFLVCNMLNGAISEFDNKIGYLEIVG